MCVLCRFVILADGLGVVVFVLSSVSRWLLRRRSLRAPPFHPAPPRVFVAGVSLETNVREGLRRPKALLAGVFSIAVLTPLVGLLVSLLDNNLEHPEFAHGLALFAAAPTSLVSSLSFVQLTKGNVTVASTIGLLSTVLAVLSMPLWLSIVLHTSNTTYDAIVVLQKLAAAVGMLLVGKALRVFPPVTMCVKDSAAMKILVRPLLHGMR